MSLPLSEARVNRLGFVCIIDVDILQGPSMLLLLCVFVIYLVQVGGLQEGVSWYGGSYDGMNRRWLDLTWSYRGGRKCFNPSVV